MKQIEFKGGYGEHGRSCFLVNYTDNRYYMVDCGIMDTDPFPYPYVGPKELAKTDYIFLTHCHKDHSGAFEFFVKNGFNGYLIATKMTLKLAGIKYDKVIILDVKGMVSETVIGDLKVSHGRSGHCPGSLWYRIMDEKDCCFFSGDYQADTFLYECDVVRNVNADIAVIDCAHNQTQAMASELRNNVIDIIKDKVAKKRKVILPVPKFGRGIELLGMLIVSFPELKIKVDTEFINCAGKMITEKTWYKQDIMNQLYGRMKSIMDNPVDIKECGKVEYDIILIADTHLAKKYNMDFVAKGIEHQASVLITGRRKKGSYSDYLCENNIAIRCIYPHHQSQGDFEAMMHMNDFKVIFPFHNNEKICIERNK